MFPSDLLSMTDVTRSQAVQILELACAMKARPAEYRRILAGKSVALLFEKPSLRTRVTFDVGCAQLGGHPVYLSPDTVQMGKREPVEDVARNLTRWVDMIVARVFAHASLDTLALEAHVPVVNALSDYEHPCQALADVQTLYERRPDFSSWRLAWVGDGNNVCRSLLWLCALVGIEVRVATPAGYELAAEDIERAHQLAGGQAAITVTQDPVSAVRGANAVYTDVWTSMGQEGEREERERAFAAYQINHELLRHAEPNPVVLHCLPARRGEEISAELLGADSTVYDQAENRLHAQKAVMALMLVEDLR